VGRSASNPIRVRPGRGPAARVSRPAAAISAMTSPGARVRDAASPAQILAAALSDGLRALTLVRDSFDVIVFYLPPRFSPCFTDGTFDLHDAVKAAPGMMPAPGSPTWSPSGVSGSPASAWPGWATCRGEGTPPFPP
jgi:hypothetical protein